MRRPFDLVVFDLGSVLVRAVTTRQEAYELAGIPFPPPDSEIGKALAAVPRRGIGAITSEEYYALFAAAWNGRYTADDARRATEMSIMGEYPGISAVFDAVDAAQVDTAILSNTNDAHWDRFFPSSGPYDYPTLQRVRHRFASHLLGMEKPDPRVYRHVELATRYQSDRILYFDDMPENVEAARSLGWTAELVDSTRDTADQMLDSLRGRGLAP